MIRRPVLIAAGLVLLLTACGGMTLHDPPNGATVNASTVNVRATWTDIQGTPDFALDGVDVTSQFTINTTAEEATATLPVTPGSHTISFGANSYCSYCNPKYQRRVLTSTFTVSGPPAPSITLSLSPTSVEVPRGGSTTTTANVTRSPAVTGPVTLAVTAIPGVTVATPSIAAAATSGPITLTAAPGASLGTTNATVTAAGPGGTPTATRQLAVKVGRRLGNFTEVQPSISGAGVTTASPMGGHRVRITLGSQVGSNHAFAATFENSSNNQTRGVAYFYQGGAGFCAGDSAGVVISNNASAFGHSSSHVFFLAYFPRNVVIDRAAQTAGGGNSVVQPRIFFSPDCSVAIMAHGNVAGTSPYIVRAIDLLTGTDFGQAVEANTITVANLGRIVFMNGQVQVEIVTDLGNARFPVP